MRAATFTTYINAQTDPGLEAAFNRQTRVALSSYSTITKAAQDASRATAGLVAGKGTAGIQNVSRALDGQARSTKAVVTAAANQERQSARTEQAMRRERGEAMRASQTHQNLARSLNTTATAFSVVEGRMSPLAGRMVTVARAAEQLSGVQLGLAGVGATLFALGRAGNEYAVLASRLRPFYDSQEQANTAMRDVIGIAQRSRTALEPIVEIYARLKSNTDQLGISQGRIGRLTEIASKAATLSGGTRQARDGALVQFSQALGANFRGAGQEFASLQEGAPLLLKAIADGYKNVDGSIGTTISNIRKLGEQGKLTSADVADALERSSVKIDKQFANLPKTLGTAGTEFGNALTVMVGRFDQSVGLTSTLASALSVVAQNLRVITGLAVGVGSAFAAIKVGNLIGETTRNVSERIALIQREAAEQRGLVLMRQQFTFEAAREASAAVAARKANIASLEAEEKQIRDNTIALRQQALAQQDVVNRARASQFGRAGGPGLPVTGITVGAAEERASAAYRKLAEESGKLSGAQAALRAEQRMLQIETSHMIDKTALMGNAMQQTVPKAGLLTTAIRGVRGAAGSLVAFLGGPWGVAFAIATTAVYLLATAEGAAERATRLHEDAQRSFAGIIDGTTGKIYDQVDALQRLAVAKKVQIDTEDANRTFQGARKDLVGLLRDASRPVRSGRAGFQTAGAVGADGTFDPGMISVIRDANRAAPSSAAQRRLDKLITDFSSDKPGSFRALSDALPALSRQIPALRQRLDSATKVADTLRSSYDRREQGNAAARVMAGTARTGDVARALGQEVRTTTGAGSPKTLTKAQIDAEVKSRSARTDLQRARAEYDKIKADGQAATETQDAYIDRLTAATLAVKSAEDAEKGLRSSRAAGNREARAAAAAQKKEAREAEAESKRAEQRGEKRRDILASYDDAPKAVDKARDQIDDLQDFVDKSVEGVAFIGKTKAEIAEISKLNPLGKGIYTQDMADADAARIRQGILKPFEDMNREADRNVKIASLQLQGREAEAEALRRTYGLVDSIGHVTAEQYDRVLANVRGEERINDLLASRGRITSMIQGTVDSTRDDFERFLTDLPNGAGKAAGNFLKSFQQRFNQINARILTERLFAGADAKVREILTGKVDVDGAVRDYVETLGRTESAQDTAATAVESFRDRVNAVTGSLATGSQPGGLGTTSVGGSTASAFQQAFAGGIPGLAVMAAAAAGAGAKAANDNGGVPETVGNEDITVTATKVLRQSTQVLQKSRPISIAEAYNTVGKGLGANLDGLYDKIFRPKAAKANAQMAAEGQTIAPGGPLSSSTFFTKLGDKLGTVMGGAATGAMTNSLLKPLGDALGFKTSKTGAQIGGAIGSLIPIPGMDIVGSIVGSVVGGLFKKTKFGAATVSVDSTGQLITGEAFGNSKAMKKSASSAGGALVDGLNSIAEQLGATIAAGANITIGQRDGKWRVNTGGTSLKTSKGAMDFGKEGAEDAVEYAIQYAIENAVLTGISQASINILKSGQDLEKAVTKAGVIESIPKRLMQIQDPVRFAITNLNTEFTKMIQYLKEGGATAAQFADAQKLYDLERAEAIKQASADAGAAINDFLKEMMGGSTSPFSKRTTYNNAGDELSKFKADIASGKSVDQQDLLTAARNFQDASRALYGSTSSFFDDFNMLKALLEKARDNAGTGTDVTTLPASPFASDSAVQAAIASLQGASTAATQTQTEVLAQKLDQVVAAVNGIQFPQSVGGSAINSLPGFANAA